MTDLDRLISAIGSRLPTVAPSLDPIWTMPPPARVIDCVLSLNRHYDRFVFPRVRRFVIAHDDVTMLSDLKTLIAISGGPQRFFELELNYRHASRADTLLGVTDYLIDIQSDFDGISELDRLRRWAEWAHPSDYIAMQVRGFGLAGFQYLRMLFGANTTKPDVHIVRFVSSSLERDVNPVQALYFLERAARQTRLPLRALDTTIWEAGARPK